MSVVPHSLTLFRILKSKQGLRKVHVPMKRHVRFLHNALHLAPLSHVCCSLIYFTPRCFPHPAGVQSFVVSYCATGGARRPLPHAPQFPALSRGLPSGQECRPGKKKKRTIGIPAVSNNLVLLVCCRLFRTRCIWCGRCRPTASPPVKPSCCNSPSSYTA